jgi:hypothetical protein
VSVPVYPNRASLLPVLLVGVLFWAVLTGLVYVAWEYL